MVGRRNERNGPWKAIVTNHGGREHRGEYRDESGDMIRVQYGTHDKCAQLNGARAEAIAFVVLGELVREYPAG